MSKVGHDNENAHFIHSFNVMGEKLSLLIIRDYRPSPISLSFEGSTDLTYTVVFSHFGFALFTSTPHLYPAISDHCRAHTEAN